MITVSINKTPKPWHTSCYKKLDPVIIDKEPTGAKLQWLARYLRANVASIWSNIKNVLKAVVARHMDYQDAQAIQSKLDGVTHYCTCTNDRVRINEMVKILEDEYVAARDAFNWFIEVLQDPQVNRRDLVSEIRRQIPPGPGPVY